MVNTMAEIKILSENGMIANDNLIIVETDNIEIICKDERVSLPEDIYKVLAYIFEPIKEYIPLDFQFLQIIFDIVHRAKLRYEENQLKKQMLTDIEDLLTNFRSYEISSNSLFVRGSLVYCRRILNKYYNIDTKEIDIITTHISVFIKQITELEVLMKNNNLADLNLEKCKGQFDKLQDLCTDFRLFPRLDDDNLDLALLLDDKYEYQHPYMLTNSL